MAPPTFAQWRRDNSGTLADYRNYLAGKAEGVSASTAGVWLAEKADRYRTVYGIFSSQDKAEQACQDKANEYFGAERTPPLNWRRDHAGYSSAVYDHPVEGGWLFQVTRFTVDEAHES